MTLFDNLNSEVDFSSNYVAETLTKTQGDFISVDGSANYSKNTRIEKLIITNDEERYKFHDTWIRRI